MCAVLANPPPQDDIKAEHKHEEERPIAPSREPEASSPEFETQADQKKRNRASLFGWISFFFCTTIVSMLVVQDSLPTWETVQSEFKNISMGQFPFAKPEQRSPARCFADFLANEASSQVDNIRVIPCVSSEGRRIPRLNRSDFADVVALLLERGSNLLEGLPENGQTTLILEIMQGLRVPHLYIDFRKFGEFEPFIARSFGMQSMQLHEVFATMEHILQQRVEEGLPPLLILLDHFESALRSSQFQAERFFMWAFSLEHKSLVQVKFLSTDAKLAASLRELVSWKLSPVAFPVVPKQDIAAYLAVVTVLEPEAIERVLVRHGRNMAVIARITAQYLRENDKQAVTASLDECLKRLVPRSDFLAHLGYVRLWFIYIMCVVGTWFCARFFAREKKAGKRLWAFSLSVR